MTPPLRRDAAANREKLLCAARQVFAEQGLDVTLDDVARAAGVGVATAYRNFANKDALVDDLLVDRVTAMVAMAHECLQEPDPWLGLRGYLDRALAMQLADRGLKQLLFAHSRAHLRVDEARKGLAPAVAELVERARAAGVVRADITASDIPLINIMVGTAIDVSREHSPALYRRYLELLLLGLRSDAPLPEPGLDLDELDAAMRCWHAR